MHIVLFYQTHPPIHTNRAFSPKDWNNSGADLGFIKGGGLTQGTNLLGRGVQSTLPSMQSMLELGGSGGMPPPGNF